MTHSKRGGVGYRAARRRLLAQRGPATAQACAECGAAARFWCYDGTDPAEHATPGGGRYSLDPAHYRARCGSCHRTTAAGRRPLTADDAARATELYQGGMSLARVAEQLGMTRPAVRTALTARRVALRPPRAARSGVLDVGRAAELYAAGVSLARVAAQLGVTRPAVRRAVTARDVPIRRRSPIVDANQAATLYASGISLARIAAQLDVTWPAVRRALTAHGVPIRPPRSAPVHVDSDRVEALYAAGASLRGIAELLGVNRSAVRAALIARGVEIRPPGPTRRQPHRTAPSATTADSAEPSTLPRPTPPPRQTRVIFQPLPATSRQPLRPSPNDLSRPPRPDAR